MHDAARRRAQGLAALCDDGAVGHRRPDGDGDVAGTGQSVAAGVVAAHHRFGGDQQRQRHRRSRARASFIGASPG